MALGHYQQTSLANAGTLLQGGFQLGVAATAGIFAGGSVGTTLGIGNLVSLTENIERTTTQAGNSQLPEELVANHTITVNFELLEFWPPYHGYEQDEQYVSSLGAISVQKAP